MTPTPPLLMQPQSVLKISSPLGSNVYFVNTTPAFIIDTGHPAQSKQTVEILKQTVPLEKTGYILWTHSHPDHTGAAFELKKLLPDVKVCCLPLEANDKLTPSHRKLLNLDPVLPQIDHYLTENEVIELSDDHLHVICTPGHADDHCCYYFSKRQLLFTGDLIAHEDIGFLNLNKFYLNAMAEMKRSLNRCSEIPTRKIFPGHGDPYRIAPWSKLQRKLSLFERNPDLLIAHTLISPFLFYLWTKKNADRQECEQYITDHAYLFNGFLPDITVDLILQEFRKLLCLLEIRDVIFRDNNLFSSRHSDNIKYQWYK